MIRERVLIVEDIQDSLTMLIRRLTMVISAERQDSGGRSEALQDLTWARDNLTDARDRLDFARYAQ